VIGHTVASGGSIATRFAGRVIQIDTGMLNAKFYPRGRPSALEISGEKLTAIYEDHREELSLTPAAAGVQNSSELITASPNASEPRPSLGLTAF
jgi:hypothetical protein